MQTSYILLPANDNYVHCYVQTKTMCIDDVKQMIKKNFKVRKILFIFLFVQNQIP